jgi:hypothetical protein
MMKTNLMKETRMMKRRRRKVVCQLSILILPLGISMALRLRKPSKTVMMKIKIALNPSEIPNLIPPERERSLHS